MIGIEEKPPVELEFISFEGYHFVSLFRHKQELDAYRSTVLTLRRRLKATAEKSHRRKTAIKQLEHALLRRKDV